MHGEREALRRVTLELLLLCMDEHSQRSTTCLKARWEDTFIPWSLTLTNSYMNPSSLITSINFMLSCRSYTFNTIV